MNSARTTYMVLLFLMVTMAAHADPILTLGESSHAAVQIGGWSSVGDSSNSSLDVHSRTSAGKFRQSALKLTLADTKSGGVYSLSSVVELTQTRWMLSLVHIKTDTTHKKDKVGKEHDDDYHAVPEPPMATTLAMGLTLLLFKLRRSK